MHPWECLVIFKISAVFQTFLSGLSPMQNMSASVSYWESPSPPAWMSTNNWDVWLWPNQTFSLLMACSSNNLITHLSSQHDMPLFPYWEMKLIDRCIILRPVICQQNYPYETRQLCNYYMSNIIHIANPESIIGVPLIYYSLNFWKKY